MKAIRSKHFKVAAALCFTAILAGCGAGSSTPKNATTPVSAGTMSVTPSSATVAHSGRQQFVASGSTVTWYVDNVQGGNSSVGTISASGLYTAPSSDGSHTVAAVSQQDPTQSGTASVSVATTAASSGSSGSSSSGSGSGSSQPVNTSGPKPTYANIDEMGGWSDCGACAGEGGHGPNVAHSLSLYDNSPSIDGKSAHFWIGGRTPFANALWWKELPTRPDASHFIYDLYFYYTNAGAAQALEFDANQNAGGRRYIFGHQCNIAAGQWDVWNTAGTQWVHTGIGCSAPPTNTWNHLVLEFERTNGQAHFIAITLNGNKQWVNRYFASRGGGGNELNVAFQMDERSNAANYDVWLDRVNLTVW